MIIDLPDPGRPRWRRSLRDCSTADLLLRALPGGKQVHHLSNGTYLGNEVGCNLLIQALNHCYDQHVPFSFAPEVAWFAISSAIGETVRQDPADYAHLFTTRPGEKQRVVVRVDGFEYGRPNDWTAGIAQFEGQLRALVPDGIIDRLLLRFSTSTPTSDVALLLAFMDAASPFYKYAMMTMCGIPRIRLEGTAADWRRVASGAAALSEVFPVLRGWFDTLLPIVGQIADTAAGSPPDLRFWGDLFKVSDDSGGPHVNGWITAFFAYRIGYDPRTRTHVTRLRTDFATASDHFGWMSNEFPLHLVATDFEWDYRGTSIPMRFASGILDVRQDGEFLAPRLGFALLERHSICLI